MRRLPAFVIAALGAVACGSGATTGGVGADAAAAAAAVDGAAGGDGAAPVDAGSATGPGSCGAPRTVPLGFAETPAAATTVGLLDVTTVTCRPASTTSLPEAVYRLELATPTKVAVKGSDRSGSGIGVQVRMESCTGASVACDWAGNGVLERTYDLPAGSWLFVVERGAAAGPFAFSLSAP
jgi:hypothetical protein